jgi:hypothetical protein
MLVTVLLGLFTGAHSHVPPCENGPNTPCHYGVIPAGPGGEAVTDTFYFVHRPLTIDGSVTVRVTSLTEVAESGLTPQGGPAQTPPALVPWSKAGLIITAGAGQGSAYAAVMVTGSHGHLRPRRPARRLARQVLDRHLRQRRQQLPVHNGA